MTSTQSANDQTFLHALHSLDFDISSPTSGLLFTKETYKDIPFNERLILQKANSLKASAVYFRRFDGKNNSIPQIFVYDNSTGCLGESDLTDIHKKIWSGGIVPLYYVVDKTQLKVFDSRKPVQYNKKNDIFVKPIDVVSLVSQAHKEYIQYSAKFFENGTFWEQKKNRNHFLANKSANNKLIEGLRRIRGKINADNNLTPTTNKLLVLSILIKYLEERKDEQGNHVFPPGHFLNNYGAESFCDVIRKGKLLELFSDLSKHFNGKIFDLTEQEKEETGRLDLNNLADFLDANIDNRQYVLWRLYAFDYLPVELISRIYEEFIPQRKDAVYTPIHLVNFIIDECMPIEEPKANFKLIDVSCGSGIFLVTAFKRLVQWWQKQEYDKKGTIESPDNETLKSIIKGSVYGVDVEPESVQLAIFSLSIALCDMLDPVQIWEELQFEDLSETNIIEDNFFNYLKTASKGGFDLIIGNPPFGGYEKEKFEELLSDYNIETSCKIPRNQVALLFLQQAMPLLKKGGLLSLVLPSGPLLYNDTVDYRKDFFTRYNIPQIIDFSAIDLFDKANYPSVVLFAENNSPDEKEILHITVKRTKPAREKLYFEIDHYDLHFVPKAIAINDAIVWKTNLLGGGHLYHMVKRFQKMRIIGKYLGDKKRRGWKYREGYNIGNGTKKATHLTGKRMVPTNMFDKNGIHKIVIENEKNFQATQEKDKEIFLRPHLLIKEKPDLPVLFVDEDLIFKHEIIGIYAPDNEKNELLHLEERIKKYDSLYKMLLLSMSGRAGISRSTSSVLKKDIMNLPYPENEKELELSEAEKIVCNDVIDYGIEHLSKGEGAKVNQEEASSKQLQQFNKTFCNALNSVYAEGEKQFYSYEPIDTASYICCTFAYGNPEKPISILQKEIEEGNLEILLENKQGESTLYRRIMHLYEPNIVYLIKPKILRYWLKSVALRDANTTFIDLLKSGY